MKNSKSILNSLSKKSQFNSLTQHNCYGKFMNMLPPRFKKAIAFVYIKNQTLFIALSHPGFKMELNYNKDLFKDLLATVQKYAPECSKYKADDIVFFNSKYYTQSPKTTVTTVPYYSELSTGTFYLNIEDKELRDKFSKTIELIQKNISLNGNHE